MLDEPTAGKYLSAVKSLLRCSADWLPTPACGIMGVQPDISVRPQIVATSEDESF
jgi:hypothetical protein